MKPTIKASQFKPWYSQAIAPNSATVIAILINSPIKNDIGLAPPAFCALANKRNANKLFGTTQHKPPNNAEKNADFPPNIPATRLVTTVVASCKRMTRSILAQVRAACGRYLKRPIQAIGEYCNVFCEATGL
jgi:hypothetical protein